MSNSDYWRSSRRARLALREDSSDVVVLANLGFALLGARQFDEALDLMRQSNTLNPNYASGFGVYGTGLAFCGEYEECIDAFGRAIRLSPRDPHLVMYYSNMSLAAFIAGHHEAGVGYSRRSVQCSTAFIGGHRTLAANLSASGQMDDARREVVEVLRVNPGVSVAATRVSMPFRDAAARERYCDALARAGLPE